ncbi:MAG: alpha-L-fucosidase [Acidobacteriota bacterium]|nr:MAG: alpha-L-fucosidase [Acidobacteriota bacterium]
MCASVCLVGLIGATCSKVENQASPLTVAEQLQRVEEGIARGPFKPDWESLKGFKAPEWYQDAKFGLFIHWGVYSVPAFGNEWYPRNMYKADTKEFQHHIETYGPHSEFGYKDFIPQLTAEKFDAGQWARLFRRSGARYIVPVAEHHDGFPMYDCSFTEWSAAKMGPKRDIIGELSEAVRSEGLHFGVSSHRVEHWWFFDQGRLFDSDVQDPAYDGLYGPARSQDKAEDGTEPPSQEYLDDWLARTAELVDRYQPELIWFDWWIAQPTVHQHLRQLAAYYYNRGVEWNRGVAINYKKHGGSSFPDEAAVLDIERGQLAGMRDLFWQTDTSVSKNSWGYIQEHDYKSVNSIVDDLIDIVSKNGCMLLNIGPRPDGTIPEREVEMLEEIGRWLEVNGEAIYETRPWKVFGEGPTAVVEGAFNDTKRGAFTAADIRFTTRDDALYVIALDWPDGGELHVQSLASGEGVTVQNAILLGGAERLEFKQDDEGLTVQFPDERPCDHAYALRLTLR